MATNTPVRREQQALEQARAALRRSVQRLQSRSVDRTIAPRASRATSTRRTPVPKRPRKKSSDATQLDQLLAAASSVVWLASIFQSLYDEMLAGGEL